MLQSRGFMDKLLLDSRTSVLDERSRACAPTQGGKGQAMRRRAAVSEAHKTVDTEP
jgi:hypothetical protein